MAFGASWFLSALSLPANHYRIGTIEPPLVLSVVGFAAMAGEIAIRVDAARTLGKFYSRTLRCDRNCRGYCSRICQKNRCRREDALGGTR
jgi:hypothetical protein